MKGLKIWAGAMSVALVLSACGGMSNTGKGALIGTAAGGAAGTGIGALVGHLTGNTKKGTIIGAAVGTAVGATTGTLIGRKMDKAAAAAKALEAAQVEKTTDSNGLDAVKVTFDNGILFAVGSSDLKAAAQTSLKKFATNVLNVYTDCDVAICGFASSDGSDATNLALSQKRAQSVSNYLTGKCGVSNSQIKDVKGYGEDPNYLIYGANGKEDVNASRRVEVYLYASEAMIKAAEAGTLE
ncbi:MAG: OmpA family protein [Bacteroidaceae bacterium]|nr:OmpA family protein [Bacteroidaceae bacterium]MDE7166112.1 OmpA family protein [Bacteroidaceae bacterium]